MNNITEFRAMYGTDIDRIDYSTPDGIKSYYNVTVTEETKEGIYLNADEVLRCGDCVARNSRYLPLFLVRAVHTQEES